MPELTEITVSAAIRNLKDKVNKFSQLSQTIMWDGVLIKTWFYGWQFVILQC